MSSLLLVPLLGIPVTATTFTPNCTLPNEITKIVNGPDIRSTWSILWSCLLTIFVCVWTVQHPAVESLAEKAQPLWKRRRDAFLTGLFQIFMSLCAPELDLGEALSEAIQAYRWSHCAVMVGAAWKSKTKWTLSHGYFMVMNGFYAFEDADSEVVEESTDEAAQLLSDANRGSEGKAPAFSDVQLTDGTQSSSPDVNDDSHILSKPETLDSLRLESQAPLNTCVIAHEEEAAEKPEPAKKKLYSESDYMKGVIDKSKVKGILRPSQLCYLVRKGLIADFPCITEGQILDKSKEDVLMKLLPMGQIVWLIIQLCVRKAHGLPSTQLEIATLSFGVCTLLTYSCWLYKPKDVREPIILQLTRTLTKTERWEFYRAYPTYDQSHYRNEESIHNDFIYLRVFKQKFSARYFGVLFGGVVFGAIHCAAWNYEFPSAKEQKLWRIASALTVSLLPAYFLLVIILGKAKEFWLIIVTIVYGVFRVMILVLTFRSLFHSPPEVFVGTWTSSIPHLGS